MAIEQGPNLYTHLHPVEPAPSQAPPDPNLHLVKTFEKRFPRLKKIGRFAGQLFIWTAVTLGSGTIGVTQTETTAPFGPHKVAITTTFDDRLTVEAQDAQKKEKKPSSISFPMVEIPSFPLLNKLDVGVHVRVKDKVPVELTKDGIIPTKISEEKLDQYASFLISYEEDIANAAKELRHTFYLYSLLGNMAVYGLPKVAQELVQTARRRQWFSERSFKRNHYRALRVALATAIVSLSAAPTAAAQLETPPGSNISSEFNMPFDGVTVDGPLLDLIENTKNYYDKIDKNHEKLSTNIPAPFFAKKTTNVMALEGAKLNSGMIQAAAKDADRSKPDFILIVGDSGLAGDQVLDKLFIQYIAYQFKEHKIYMVLGNHDPKITKEWAKKLGIILLDGETVEAEGGIRILGNADQKDRDALALRTANAVCKDKRGMTIVAENQPSALKEVEKRNCPYEVTVAGGFDRNSITSVTPTGKQVHSIRLRGLGGDIYSDEINFSTITELQTPADFSYLTFDESHELLGTLTKISNPDTSAELLYDITPEGYKFLVTK